MRDDYNVEGGPNSSGIGIGGSNTSAFSPAQKKGESAQKSSMSVNDVERKKSLDIEEDIQHELEKEKEL